MAACSVLDVTKYMRKGPSGGEGDGWEAHAERASERLGDVCARGWRRCGFSDEGWGVDGGSWEERPGSCTYGALRDGGMDACWGRRDGREVCEEGR